MTLHRCGQLRTVTDGVLVSFLKLNDFRSHHKHLRTSADETQTHVECARPVPERVQGVTPLRDAISSAVGGSHIVSTKSNISRVTSSR